MKILSFLLLTLLGFSCMNKENTGSESISDFNMDEYKACLKFLSDDKLQGRLPGTVGSDIAALYIASKFESFNLKPISAESGYLQPVSIKSIRPDYKSAKIIISGEGFHESIKPYDEALVITRDERESQSIEGDLVFVGYGAIAPEYDWNDYKDVAVKNKIVVCLTNHPDFQSKNFTEGNTTYYGSWEYKPQMAYKQGAKGIIIIYQNDALFPFSVFQDVFSRTVLGEYSPVSKIPLISYISEEGFDRVLQKVNMTTKDLVTQAGNRDFKPFSLPLHFKSDFRQSITEYKTPNVIGLVQGTEKPEEAILFMAHYDHVGTKFHEHGDSIYNGAIDNASGVAGILSLAEYYSRHPAKRSVIFLATTAEETFFQGAEHYLNNPVIPLEQTIFGLNLDMMNFLGRIDSIELAPLQYTNAIDQVSKIAEKMKIGLKLSVSDREYLNFRVESYPFALKDVLAMNLVFGEIEEQYPSLSSSELEEIVNSGGLNYHTPYDEIKSWFRYDGILQELEFAKELGNYYADDGIKPKFNHDNPYTPVKELWSEK